jgi:hypothetical protein
MAKAKGFTAHAVKKSNFLKKKLLENNDRKIVYQTTDFIKNLFQEQVSCRTHVRKNCSILYDPVCSLLC